jgi:14-3-3 protein epsilon
LIDEFILEKCSSSEGKVFFLKMKGDYHRYISEYAQHEQHENASQNADKSYKEAIDIVETDLKTTNPIRLGLYLNYSVFCYEVLLLILGVK